jgi:hypothetical protein
MQTDDDAKARKSALSLIRHQETGFFSNDGVMTNRFIHGIQNVFGV